MLKFPFQEFYRFLDFVNKIWIKWLTKFNYSTPSQYTTNSLSFRQQGEISKI